ncbi:hypothetical protein DGG96_13125 [Legionella qingyii]|uniref:Dot/Icm T4SS effector n=1 Tax=Legionella qingyii TaxID=2184757 RepID=A0A317U172_9GAMM|nr:hypothetical protein [Legionella qingyii]PWY55119.1 hypothetical protein DGG96_13125 [Legionella qingyii]RUR25458.1 hypothetical protein ELY20_03090 [Legionella qingyii]RUR28432.1 hypothetical protein ELY16_02920 [Legionella qingyii]
MSYRIDNSGGGDCGFYAFAIGLINTIQNEYSLHGKSKTYERWNTEGLHNVSLQEILEVDLNQLYHSPRTYKNQLLFMLQMSLRNIAFNVYKNELFNRIKGEEVLQDHRAKIEATPIFGKFRELVDFYLHNKGSLAEIRQFNELALSPEVLILAERTAQTLQVKLQKPSADSPEQIELEHVKNVVLHDVMSAGKENPDSVILKGVEKIREQGRWATHDDLKEIAAHLDVNLYVVGKENGVTLPDRPTICLNNEGNAHWTTNVEQLAPKEEHVATPPVPKKPQEQIKEEEFFSKKEEQVIVATVSTQGEEDKVDLYRKNIKELIQAASTQGLFSQVKNKIDVDKIDTAEALKNEWGEQIESDADFAARLQEAELRRVLG